MKNGFVNIPFGSVVVWVKSNTCPPGYIPAVEIPSEVYLRFNTGVNLVLNNTGHTHTTVAHQHTSTDTDSATGSIGNMNTNGPSAQGGNYNFGATGRIVTIPNHVHLITPTAQTLTYADKATTTSSISQNIAPYTYIKNCRRM